MDPQTIEHLRTKLLNRREICLGRRGRLLEERQQLEASRDGARKHVSAEQEEAARLSGLAHLETQALERIEASLERMKNGTYGVCVACHGRIEAERLQAMPDVTRCAGCTH